MSKSLSRKKGPPGTECRADPLYTFGGDETESKNRLRKTDDYLFKSLYICEGIFLIKKELFLKKALTKRVRRGNLLIVTGENTESVSNSCN